MKSLRGRLRHGGFEMGRREFCRRVAKARGEYLGGIAPFGFVYDAEHKLSRSRTSPLNV
jgi:hypothetical protein